MMWWYDMMTRIDAPITERKGITELNSYRLFPDTATGASTTGEKNHRDQIILTLPCYRNSFSDDGRKRSTIRTNYFLVQEQVQRWQNENDSQSLNCTDSFLVQEQMLWLGDRSRAVNVVTEIDEHNSWRLIFGTGTDAATTRRKIIPEINTHWLFSSIGTGIAMEFNSCWPIPETRTYPAMTGKWNTKFSETIIQ